ncbi:MAG: IS481 family transposase, partial [Boseongicola sp. SB0670_bin_30]|nr:IS481 family transposase [Boseongicola sp. SB0670_bin_30]
MAMLEGIGEPLTLQMLNDATIAWLEHDYHCRVHRELGVTPLERLKQSDNAARDCPDSAALRSAFR